MKNMKYLKLFNGVVAVVVLVMPFYFLPKPANAAALSDGTWAHNTIDVVTITTQTVLAANAKVILTFSQETSVVGSPTGCTVDGSVLTPVVDATRKTYTWTLASGKSAGVLTLGGCLMVSGFNPSGYKAHTVAINTVTAAGSAVDTGVATTYNGTAGGNGVAVTVVASVPQFLNMNLSKTAIDLGILNTAVVSTDSHTITISTNDTAGYKTEIGSSGNLVNANSDFINPIVEDREDPPGTPLKPVQPGRQEYGIAVAAGGGATENGNFADDDSPIPVSFADFITNTAAANAHVHTVTYRAAISGTTPAGNYTQTVYYKVSTNL